MKIKKILNNNVVCLESQFGSEIIAMGKGIGFQKKQGDLINQKLIEKRFYLQNNKNFLKIYKLFNNIELHFFKISDEIIAFAKAKKWLVKMSYFILYLQIT